ncbi:MAG: helix-turn-helix domain-containing protein [Phycisphaerales bacterium]|nr:helix-turn-helix domain-containing protein [Phycisphaerales bacterium]
MSGAANGNVSVEMNARADSAPQGDQNRPAARETILPIEHDPARHAFPRLLTLTEAARLLRVHPNTLKAQRRLGRLAVVRIGRRVLIDPSDLNSYIDSQREAPCVRTDSLNTGATGSCNDPTPPISPSTGADRGHDASSAAARARAILTRLNAS